MGRPAAKPKPCKSCGNPVPLLGMGRPREYHDECRPAKDATAIDRDPRRRRGPASRVVELVPPAAYEPETPESRVSLLFQGIDLAALELVRALSGQPSQTPLMAGSLPNVILSSAKAINMLSGGFQPTFGAMILEIPDPGQPITERVKK